MQDSITKLTLVSITFKGIRYSKFVRAEYRNGKLLYDYDNFADSLGIRKGQTYITA